MGCLPATIQCFKWLLLLILAHRAFFLSDVSLLNHSFCRSCLTTLQCAPILHAVDKASQARRRSLLLTNPNIHHHGVLRPKASVSRLSNISIYEGYEGQQRDESGNRNPKKSDTSGTDGLFSTSRLGSFVRVRTVGCKWGLLPLRTIKSFT